MEQSKFESRVASFACLRHCCELKFIIIVCAVFNDVITVILNRRAAGWSTA